MEVESAAEKHQMEVESCLRMQIEKLKRTSMQDKLRFDQLHSELQLSKLTSSQETTMCKSECVLLKETMARLESDKNALKDCELKNQEMVLSLYKKIHHIEAEFAEKMLELKVQTTNLENSKRKIDDEIKELVKKCEDLKRNCCVEKMGDKRKIGQEAVKNSKNSGGDNCSDNDLIPLSTLLERKISTNLAKKKHASYNVCNFRIFENTQKSPTTKRKLLDSEMKIQSCYMKRNKNSKRGYTGRIACSEQIAEAVKRAEEVQKNLNSGNLSCIKAMVPSNVSGSLWLSLPLSFKKNLPQGETMMILEDERGLQFDVKYIARTNGLSGGWGRFAVAHKLEVGDVLVFELTQPTRFKIHVIKAVQGTSNYISYTAAKGREAEYNVGFQPYYEAYNEAVRNWKRKASCGSRIHLQ